MTEPSSKPKLHELLAIEQERKATADRARRDILQLFEKRQSHFNGMRRTYRPFAVDEALGETAGERIEADTRLVTTVPEQLEELFTQLGPVIDISLQMDEANARARGDIIIDGEVLAADLPATFLIQLEKRLREVRALIEHAPTRDPIRPWEVDGAADKPHVFRATPVTTIRKQRTRKYNVMYEATKEHPAQIDVVEVDEPVGEIRAYDWTGMISQSKHAALLAQVDRLINAVKQARSRANRIEIDTQRRIAGRVFEFIKTVL